MTSHVLDPLRHVAAAASLAFAQASAAVRRLRNPAPGAARAALFRDFTIPPGFEPTRLTFAAVGIPAADGKPTHDLHVFDLVTGRQITEVIEVDTVERYVIRLAKNAKGEFYTDPKSNPRDPSVAKERLTGDFTILRKTSSRGS